MNALSCASALVISGMVITLTIAAGSSEQSWPQWGQNAQHSGFIPVVGQSPSRILAHLTYDRFAESAQAEARGSLLTHYQAPLVDGDDVFMAFKTGSYASCSPPGSGEPFPCGPNAWQRQIWNVARLNRSTGRLHVQWTFPTDWKPLPNAFGLNGWEPVFHPALAGRFVYVPGAGGTLWKVSRLNPRARSRLNPFGAAVDPNTYVVGPLTIDDDGAIYYNALTIDPVDPSGSGPVLTDIPGAWLVRISEPDGTSPRFEVVDYKNLIPGAPTTCVSQFANTVPRPLPPSPDALPAMVACGSQRPGVNVAPAVAPDGTVYSATRAHGPSAAGERYSYLVALAPDLTLKWAASLRDRLSDGCNNDQGTSAGAWFPANGTSLGCRIGATAGVDPFTNQPPAGRVSDRGSSSPVVAPDGSVLYGAFSAYNGSRGHLFRFFPDGALAGVYGFGWDLTPAIFPHDGTFSVVIKDNTYGTNAAGVDTGPFYIRQLSADLSRIEWTFQSTNTRSCARGDDESVRCLDDHPNGFEWCINAPAIDAAGNVYANNEDGRLYVIGQGGRLVGSIFTNLALGAAYTPLALGGDGRIYTQNDGHLFVIGQAFRRPPFPFR